MSNYPKARQTPPIARRTGNHSLSTRFSVTGQVSVILPVYNEQASIQKTFEALLHYLPDHPNYKFIFVNDGSCDRTKEILAAGLYATKARRIELLSYSPRAGKGYAVRRGVEYTDSDIICYLDGDLSYSLDHLDELVEKLRSCDVVIGARTLARGNGKKLKLKRKLAGKVSNFLASRILNLNYSDMQSGLVGFRGEAARNLFGAQELTDAAFDVELIYLAKKWGYTIGEIPAKVSTRHRLKPSNVNLLQDSIRMLIDLLKIRLNDCMGLYR
ncbi:MAG: glycosyltransferase [Myxacorys chilensis ATA2-1-KO14]|nr:glycosyltransferase [Myxacorys chilensis ATA2-1-KO14]